MSALGSLVVKLGMEYAEYTAGLTKTEQATLATVKRVQDTFDDMKRQVATTVGAIAGGLAVGLSVGAFRNLLAGVIETGARLDDLRMQTGETVEALSALLAVGKYNDVGADQLGAMMQKLSSNLSGATEESKGTALALDALGIRLEDFKRLSPAEQLQQIAQGLGKFEDGAGKSAVAIALLGKEGANALPFFTDLASVGELQAKVTTEQAAAAANLDDNLARLTTSGDGWKRELVSGMVPALDLGAQALLDVMNGTGGIREEVRRLVADGSIREWTKSAITGLSYVSDAAQYAWRTLQSVGKGLGGLAAGLVLALQGDLEGAWRALQDSGADMIDAFSGETLGSRLRERMADIEATGAAAEAAKPKLDFANVVDKSSKAADAAKRAFDGLIESIDKRTTQFAAELAAEEKLTEGEKLAVDVLEQLRSGKVQVTAAQAALIGKRLEALLVIEKEVKANQAAAQALEAERAARVKARLVMEEGAASLLQSNEELEREIELIGLTESQQLAVLQARNAVIILTKEATLAELERRDAISGTMSREQIALAAEIQELKRRNELLGKKQVREEEFAAWTSMWQSIDQTAHDVFVNVFEDGAGTFKRLGQTLKAFLLDLLYQMTIKRWIVNVSANFMGGGAGGVAGAAGGGNSLMGMASNASTAYSLITGGMASSLGSMAIGLGNLIGSSAITSFGAGMAGATLAPGLMGPTTIGAAGAMGAGASVGSMLAAIPGWGWALAAIGALFGGDIFNSLFGRKLKDSGIEGQFGGETGFEGRQYEYYKGGLFRSNKTKYKDLDDDVRAGLGDQFLAMRQSTVTMAKVLGLGTSAIENFTANVKISLKGLSAEEAQKKLQEEFDKIAQSMASTALGTEEYSRKGETAVDTLVRLSTGLSSVNGLFDALGLSLFDASLAAADAASNFVDLFGGLENLNAAAKTYYENFYSDEERRDKQRADINKQLDTLGLERINFDAPDARAQFRALLEREQKKLFAVVDEANAIPMDKLASGTDGAAGQVGKSAQEVVAALLSLSGAFAAVTRSSDEAAEASRRAAEEAKQEAERKARAATDTAWASVQKSIQAARDAAQAEIALRQERIDAARAVVEVARSQARELRGLVDGVARMSAVRAQSWIDQALATVKTTGYLPDAQALGEAVADARSGMGADAYSNRLDYEAAQLILANKLEELQASGLATLSVDELLLDAARAEVDRLDTLSKTLREALDEARGTKVAVRDVESAVREFYARMFEETGAGSGTGGAGGKPTGPSYSGVQGGSPWKYGQGYATDPAHFQEEFDYGRGRGSKDVTDPARIDKLTGLRAMLKAEYGAGSAEDLARIAAKARAMGATTDDIGAALGFWGDDIRKIFSDAGVPAFAGGGTFGGGLRLVGEYGPELEITGPSRIYSASQTRQLLQGMQGGGGAGADVVRAVDGLRTMLYEALRALYDKTADSERTLRKLDALGIKQREEAPA